MKMVKADINLYDTEGIPLLREGELIPWSDVGMSYEDIDKLGVWILMNKQANRVTVAMRLDEMFSGGRYNRRILTLRISYEDENELELVVEKFPEVIGRFLRMVEEKGIASYRGPVKTESKWNYLVTYVPKTARILRSFRDMPRIKLPYLNYSKPSISERADMFRFFMHLSRSLGASRFMGIFSKSGSVSPAAVWICGDGRPLDELEAKIEAARLRKKRTKPASERKGPDIVYSVGAFILGALIVLGLVYAGILGGTHPKAEGPSVVPAASGEFRNVQKAMKGLPADERILMEGYLSFANETDEVNMSALLSIVLEDIRLHREYLTRMSSMNRTLRENEKKISGMEKNLTALQKSLNEFREESRYFALVVGSKGLTLKQGDVKRLKSGGGITAWLGIMRGQCKITAGEKAGTYRKELKNLNTTLSNYSSVLDNIGRSLKEMNATKADVFMHSRDRIDERMKNISELWKELGDSVKGIKTCRDAYLWEMNWSRRIKDAGNISGLYMEALKLTEEVKEKGINSTLIKGPVLDYAREKGYSSEALQKKIDELFVQAQKPLELFMKLEELLKWIQEGAG
ncbi:hypothetical protein [Thermococcus sp.]